MHLRTCAAAVVLAACGSPKLHHTLPPNVFVDTYDQVPVSAVDVLWVIDNSGSMQDKQQNLARNMQSFMDLFTQSAVDYRLAVTTMDIFHTQGAFVGATPIVTPQTPDPIDTFITNVQVGITGGGYDEGLEAARMSLAKQLADNAPVLTQLTACQSGCGTSTLCLSQCTAQYPVNFLRPGAYLYLVFVTDGQDRSPYDERYYWRYLTGVKGLGNDGEVTLAAIVGDVAQPPCAAVYGTRYLDLVQLTHGTSGSICDAQYADTLHALATDAVGLKRTFALTQAPNVQTLSVSLKYACNTPASALTACASTDNSGCQGAAPTDKALVCTPVQGGSDGWSYEATPNVIYFAGASLPGLNAEIDIQYYLQGTGP